jgi:hypothetical protein
MIDYRIKVAELSEIPRPVLELQFATLAAIMGGDRTIAQIEETVGAEVPPLLLDSLLCQDLLAMRVVDGVRNYLPVVYKRRGVRRGGTR